jgi:DNA-binding LytR/AlgR family response regulator
MENKEKTKEEKMAEILAGMSKKTRKLMAPVLKDPKSVISAKSLGHYKRIWIQDGGYIDIKISFEKLNVLLPEGLLQHVHESWWLHFDHVKGTYRLERDQFAIMDAGPDVPIGREKAMAFKQKCKEQGKL